MGDSKNINNVDHWQNATKQYFPENLFFHPNKCLNCLGFFGITFEKCILPLSYVVFFGIYLKLLSLLYSLYLQYNNIFQEM